MDIREEILDELIDENSDIFNILGEHIEEVLSRISQSEFLDKDLYEDLIEQIYNVYLKDSCCSSENEFTEDEFIDLCLFYLDYLKGDKQFNSEEIIKEIDKDKVFIKEYEKPVLRKDPKKQEKMDNSLLEYLKSQATTSGRTKYFKQSISSVEDLEILEKLDDYLSDKEVSKTVRMLLKGKKNI